MDEDQVKKLLAEKASKAEATERTATGTTFAACAAIKNTKGDKCDAVAVVVVWQELDEKWSRITRGCELHASRLKNAKASVSHNPLTVKEVR